MWATQKGRDCFVEAGRNVTHIKKAARPVAATQKERDCFAKAARNDARIK
jgi:hypothetical protein